MKLHVRWIVPAALAGLTAASAPAQADLRYTTAVQVGGKPDLGDDSKPLMTTTTFVQGMRERTETSIQAGPISRKTVSIMQCDTHQTIRLDPDLKIYTVSPVGAVGLAAMGNTSGQPRRHKEEGKGGEGKVETTLNVQDLGSETVNDIKSHHFLLTMHVVQSGCLGNHDDTAKIEMWTAPIKGGRMVCPETTAPTRTVDNGDGCHVTYILHGDMDTLKNIYGGLPVRTKVYKDDKDSKAVVQMDTKDYSTDALDAGLFDAPADYKKVSEEDFDKQETQAMMKGMGMPDMGGEMPKPQKPKIHFPF